MAKKTEKILLSHTARVTQANEMLKKNPRYKRERILIVDR